MIFGSIDIFIRNLSTWAYRSGNISNPGFARYKENRIKIYDVALRYVDHMLGNLVNEIQERSVYETIFVITSDHGEEFWAHAEIEKKLFYDPRGWWGVDHGHNLFQEIIKVPLILYSPGNISPGERRENVSLVDVFPTILELLSMDHRIPCDGRSLLSVETTVPIFSEEVAYGFEKKAVIKGEHKLISSDGDAVSLLFNLKRDPMEKTPIKEPSIEEGLQNLICQKETKRGEKQKTTRDIRRRLQELGYL